MPDDERDQPAETSVKRSQPKGPLRRMEERERRMEEQLHGLDEDTHQAKWVAYKELRRQSGE
jgi:hypothetical protein